MIPPTLLLCPECGTVAVWNNHHYIITMLECGNAFILIYCPYCKWTVRVDALPPEPERQMPF